MRIRKFAGILCGVVLAGGVCGLPSGIASEVKGMREVRLEGDMKLTLEGAVDIALKQNPQILEAQKEIERVYGLYMEVRAEALPKASILASYSQQDEALSAGGGLAELFGGGGNQDKSWRVALQGTQVLYAGGQVRGALNIAKHELDAAKFQLQNVVDQVIELVRTQYYETLRNRALIEVQEESVELLTEELRDQQSRFDAGTVPRFNVLRAEVELANVQPMLIRAENNYRISLLNLAKTLGMDYDRSRKAMVPFEVVTEFDLTDVTLELADAMAMALERRAFLKAQRQQILSQSEQVKVAFSGYLPRLEANAGYEVRNDQFSNNLDDTLDGWFFGVQGNWNIFDGFATAGRLKQARAALQSAVIRYEDSVRQVELEVQEVYSRLQEARELIASQQKNVEQATEALRLSRERLSAGAGTQLDILDARVALTRAQTTELEAKFDFARAKAQFYRVTAVDTDYDEVFEDPLSKQRRRLWKQMDSRVEELIRELKKEDSGKHSTSEQEVALEAELSSHRK